MIYDVRRAMWRMEEGDYPLSYRFGVSAPWGRSHFDLTWNIPTAPQIGLMFPEYGQFMLRASIALAMSWRARVDSAWVCRWAEDAVWTPLDWSQLAGQESGAVAARGDSACITMMSDHTDPEGFRRLTIPGVPAAFAEEGMLTTYGAEQVQTLARAMIAGTGLDMGASSPVWMMLYPNAYPEGIVPAARVGFRYVRRVRVCQHTDRAPDFRLPGFAG